MRVLQLHNRYQITGGEEGVVRAEKALLETYGHTVKLFEVSNDEIIGTMGKAIAATSAIYSTRSRQRVTHLLQEFQPQIVHVHNFFPLLSPSVYDACQTYGAPVIQTLHNYRLGCPKAMFFRNNQVCEDCLTQVIPWSGVIHGCYRGSRSQTAVIAAMLGWHRWRGTWRDRVSAYIALTNFQKHKLTAAGLPTQKIHVKPNFIFPPPLEPNPRENFALFVGRLAEEKGVSDLIAAYRYGQIHLPLKIVGDGPLRQALIEQTHTAGLEETISFLGRQERSTVLQLMQQAQFLIFPSIWYEGFPLTIVEAFACQLPVIVPAIGSMAEIVQDHETGLQFTANNPQDLSEKIQWAIQHATDMQDMGEQARQTYETCYTPEINYDRLMSIYQTALAA